jgi:hypothetical protein
LSEESTQKHLTWDEKIRHEHTLLHSTGVQLTIDFEPFEPMVTRVTIHDEIVVEVPLDSLPFFVGPVGPGLWTGSMEWMKKELDNAEPLDILKVGQMPTEEPNAKHFTSDSAVHVSPSSMGGSGDRVETYASSDLWDGY